MTFIREVGERIEKEYTLDRADTSWDNVGVLLEFESSPSKEAKEESAVLLCVDITHRVLDECERKNIRAVVAYHPVIFNGIKKINRDTPLLYRCINGRISVYTPHSALDGGHTGVNAWLGGLVGGSKIVESVGFFQIFTNKASIREILGSLSKKLGLSDIRYSLGDGHSLESVPEKFLTGCGSCGRGIKKLLEETGEVKSSEKSVPELVITGEVSHHDLLYMNRTGTSVVILEHSRSERGFLHKLKEIIEADSSIKAVISEEDEDPVRFYRDSQE